MSATILLLSALFAFTVTTGLLAWLLKQRPAWLPMDRPNERSLHSRPVPRGGGAAVLAGAVLVMFLTGAVQWAWLGPALVLAVLSWADDRRSLPVTLRLVVQAGAALAFLLLLPVDKSWPVILVMLTAIVWMTNLYNFMDGSDGLAGGMTVCGFGAYALVAALQAETALAVTCLSLAAASLGFLPFNFQPARVFLGDVGSVPMGFLAAALGVAGWRDGVWAPLFPVLVFAPFIVDASVTILRRLVRGEVIWRPHTTHYFQRLIRMGWSHRRTALAAYVLMILTAIAVFWAERTQDWMRPSIVIGSVYLVILAWVDYRWRRFNVNRQNVSQSIGRSEVIRPRGEPSLPSPVRRAWSLITGPKQPT